MRRPRVRGRRLLALLVLAGLLVLPTGSASAAGTPLSGTGSTYVALAMTQWVADGQNLGLDLNYTANGSIAGMNFYGEGTQDFAGTEAEFSSVYGDVSGLRSYQYVPDVAGATAMMYNIKDAAGKKVDYLHLSPHTIAAIFTGNITRWNDPVIRAENLGTQFEDRPVHVILRSSASGTTALFYDFVAHAAPELWAPFRAKNQLSEALRVNEIREDAIPGSTGVGSSDQIAQYIANDASGSGAIGYDEFGYARTFRVPVAWVQNASGKWVQPYAANISAALDGATLRPDLSQELSTVYTSTNPLAYPASAYSYIALPCEPTTDRQTCNAKGDFDPGRLQTMSAWLDYIGCQGQVKMAQLGYSPLPPVLSQEVQNSIQRMSSTTPRARALTAANCANPRFSGSLGAGSASPPDPFAKVDPATFGAGTTGRAPAAGTPGGAATRAPAAAGPGAADPAAAAPAAAAGTPAGQAAADTAADAVGGGSNDVRGIAPVAYRGADPDRVGVGPGVLLLVVVGLPPLLAAAWQRGRRRRRSAVAS